MRLQVDGEWPGHLVFRRGWSRAYARPWNDDVTEGALRLDRGGHIFLRDAASQVRSMASGPVYSPALYPLATRVWRRAGFSDHLQLDVMEMALGGPWPRAEHSIDPTSKEDLNEVAEVDRLAFQGFWRIGRAGIKEALDATNHSALLVAKSEAGVVGYSVVGAQLGTSFLQRIAVVPSIQGRGFGRSLLARSLEWASRRGARVMMLNVRPENTAAVEFYVRAGFSTSPQKLSVVRFE